MQIRISTTLLLQDERKGVFMIYMSTTKINNILERYEKKSQIDINNEQVNINFPFVKVVADFSKNRNQLDKVIKLLRKEKLYHETTSLSRTCHYYKIAGKMVYKDFKTGVQRINNSSIKINNTMFFHDEKLVFDIDLDRDYSLKKIEMECSVQNIKCFSSQEVGDCEIFSPNTADPGILCSSLDIESVIELRRIKSGSESGTGSPIYINLVRG